MKNYQYFLKKIGEYGSVREIHYPIATIVGLPHVKPNELVIFEGDEMGEVFSISNDSADVLLFSKDKVKIDMQVTRTDTFVNIPVGKEQLGKIIDPLGRSFFDRSELEGMEKTIDVDRAVKGINQRKRITRPFMTGISLVDLLIPLGKGQRELVIGDRKTGKSSFLYSVMKTQVQLGAIVIYAAIGKKKSDIKKIQEFFISQKLMDSIVIVASDPFDSPNLIFLTPYAAMSIAEYFCEAGSDVVVIFDDLSTHAKFYREMGLLAGRFPGRDSYPGDIFYIHARLLERAGNFIHPQKGEVSITAIPVAEIIEGDLTGFIATNIMGMTDGHIFFDSDVYYKGRRPAINTFLSVTRVGRQTQNALRQEINREITAFLSNYEKLQTFSHFGAELSEKVRSILKTGEHLQAFFDQHYSVILSEEVQLVLLALIWLHALDEMPLENVTLLRNKMIEKMQDESFKKNIVNIIRTESFHELLLNVAKNKDQYLALVQK